MADALAAHKPFMLVFATPKFCTSQQCGPTLDHFKPIAAAHPEITFINVEPYKLQFVERRPAAGPRCERASSRRPTSPTSGGSLSEPWIFAVDGTGIVRGSYEVDDHATPSSTRSCRSSAPAADRPAARLGRVLEPDRDLGRRPRSDTRRGPAARSPGARRGGRAGTRRRSRGRRSRTGPRSPSVVRRVKPWTSVEARRLDADDDPDDLLGIRRRPRIGLGRATEQERGRAGQRDDRDEGDDEQIPGARVHRRSARASAGAAGAADGAGPGAARGVERGAVGAARAGRRDRARTSAGRAARARGAGRRGRSTAT